LRYESIISAMQLAMRALRVSESCVLTSLLAALKLFLRAALRWRLKHALR
jgi:hypothetical protein